MRHTDQKPENLNRPEGNDLQSNYEKHDPAERRVKELLKPWGLTAKNWGIDEREIDDHLVFDDKMDLKIYREDTLVGIVEVKRKTSDRWMFKINKRHWDHYTDINDEYDIPVYIVFVGPSFDMYWVDVDDATVLREFTFPDGNGGIELEPTNSFFDMITTFKGQ